MALMDLIRPGYVATATPAISAIDPELMASSVAEIATIAVANPARKDTKTLAKVIASSTASSWWLVHYIDRDPVEVACSPELTHAEILRLRPDAIAAEPFTPTPHDDESF
jgi:hypothetical protein